MARRIPKQGIDLRRHPAQKLILCEDSGFPKNHLRVAYSHATTEEIDDGIRRLATAYRAITAGSQVIVA